MRHDDRVCIANMVEFAHKAHERVASRERAELDGDESLQRMVVVGLGRERSLEAWSGDEGSV
jgi:hypothetical protein